MLNWVGLGPLNFPTVGGWKLTLMMIVVMIWIQAGFATVVLSAAIKAVPAEIVEAAKIDGATQGQAFRRVVVPNIRPTLIVVLVTISIATLKVFDLVRTFGADKYGGDTLANLMYTTYQQSGLPPGGTGSLARAPVLGAGHGDLPARHPVRRLTRSGRW